MREQIRSIKNELGEESYNIGNDEFAELKEKIINSKMPEDIEKEALKQLARLEKMHPDSSESGILRTYVEWLIDLPWSASSQENCDLKRAKEILNEDHFELKKVKERILEFLAVKQLKGEVNGPILCFSGPPGVGKTSLGNPSPGPREESLYAFPSEVWPMRRKSGDTEEPMLAPCPDALFRP